MKELADPRKGIVTMNDDLFIRLWHEVVLNDIYFNAENIIEFDMSAAKYAPIKCGGGFRKWYGNKFNVIKWQNNGKEIKTYITEVSGDHYSRQIFNQDRFFCESLTWNSIASNNVCFRYHEEGALFGSSGPSMFPADHKDYILALLNTNVAYHIIKLINPSQNLGPSVVSKLPFVLKNEERVKEISCNNVAISKEDWDSFETSWDFKKHPLI